jgi:hypothetical protein
MPQTLLPPTPPQSVPSESSQKNYDELFPAPIETASWWLEHLRISRCVLLTLVGRSRSRSQTRSRSLSRLVPVPPVGCPCDMLAFSTKSVHIPSLFLLRCRSRSLFLFGAYSAAAGGCKLVLLEVSRRLFLLFMFCCVSYYFCVSAEHSLPNHTGASEFISSWMRGGRSMLIPPISIFLESSVRR